MKYRHECKFEISYSDLLMLKARLSAVAKKDVHTTNGVYEIRSLYFDNLNDIALMEKINGMNRREKFRIRYYDKDTNFIKLEKKSKINHLSQKKSVNLTKAQVQDILDGNYDWMIECKEPLLQEFYSKIKTKGLRPKTIVEYTREPFVFPYGNVRVTLDYNIRTSSSCHNFLNPVGVTLPVKDAPIILEVKWDEYLPDVIKDVIQMNNHSQGAFSKYAACRIYG